MTTVQSQSLTAIQKRGGHGISLVRLICDVVEEVRLLTHYWHSDAFVELQHRWMKVNALDETRDHVEEQ